MQPGACFGVEFAVETPHPAGLVDPRLQIGGLLLVAEPFEPVAALGSQHLGTHRAGELARCRAASHTGQELGTGGKPILVVDIEFGERRGDDVDMSRRHEAFGERLTELGHRLDRRRTWLDYPMFQELCYQGNALVQDGDLQEGIVAYQSAERLYPGDFLADIPLEYAANEEFDWCWGRRYWFKEMHLKMLSSLSALYRQTQQLAEALTYADKALRLEPCSEIAHREKMLALHAANRRDAVERQYRLYLHSLERFGMGEPSSAVTGLYESLRGN